LMRPPQLATFLMAWEANRFTIVCSSQLGVFKVSWKASI
jgi:hypothetical protein